MSDFTPAAGCASPRAKFDPFNWPALNRSDLISQKILNSTDGFAMKVGNLRPKQRMFSANLATDDIEGKSSCSLGSYKEDFF